MAKPRSLKHVAFLWLSLGISLPLVGLLLLASDYSRHQYETEIHRDVADALNRVVAAFDRRSFIEQDLIRGLSQVPPVQDYLPVLGSIAQGQRHTGVHAKTAAVANYFETFQLVRRSLGAVRVLDVNGNTLLMVRNGQSISAQQVGPTGILLVENGAENPDFVAALQELHAGDVGSLAQFENDITASNAVYNMVLPLSYQGRKVGYLMTEAPLAALDQTLDVAPRPRNAGLVLVEVNPDNPLRDGMVLYADHLNISLSDSGQRKRLASLFPGFARQAVYSSEGHLTEADGSSLYFNQYLPYPDRLVGWAFVFHIENGQEARPFRLTPFFLSFGLLLAIVAALLLAYLGTRHLAAPIYRLSRGLGEFAAGDFKGKLQPTGPLEVHQAVEAFNRMAETLRQAKDERDRAQQAVLQNAKLASVGQLAAGIGHELSNPLSNIYSLTRLLRRRLEADDPALGDVELIREEAERASGIIKGLLSFARQAPANPVDLPVRNCLLEGIGLVERMAKKRDIEVQLAAASDAIIHADKALLLQALLNVLINAVQASPHGGRVLVEQTEQGRGVQVSVSDQGDGIADGDLDHLFDPFFTTKPEGEGTGLGLSIALGILQRHGGGLTLENLPQGGARAVLFIPFESKESV